MPHAEGAGVGGGEAVATVLSVTHNYSHAEGAGVGGGEAVGTVGTDTHNYSHAEGAGVGGGEATAGVSISIEAGSGSAAEPGWVVFDSRASGRVILDPTVIPATPPRAQPGVAVAVPEPAIILGKPIIPGVWARPTVTATSAGTGYNVTIPPPPIITIPPRPPGSGGASLPNLVWKASDLPLGNISTWPDTDGHGYDWKSHAPYRPNVTTKQLTSTRGKIAPLGKVLVTNYRRVEHMWIDFQETFQDPFTFVIAGIILSYPTARYGHYLIDVGKTPNNRTSINYGHVKPIPGEHPPDHRTVMLMQKSSGLLSSGGASPKPWIEKGPYVRTRHNWTPQPRVFGGVFDGNTSRLFIKGRNYERTRRGKTSPGEDHRYVTLGRRCQWTSTDMASHVAYLEVRFFPKALSLKELRRQARNLSARYDFDKYRF